MSSNLSRAPCLLRSRLYTTIRLAYRGRLTVPQVSRALPTSRPFSTSPPKALKVTSPSLNWHEPSPERIIQQQIAAGKVNKWGWVVYRTAYQPELDAAWATLQRVVLEDLCETVAESDAPEIAEQMEWLFVEDPELDGASLDELKRRFRAWARADAPYDLLETEINRPGRYDLFVQADEEALRCFVPDPGSYNAAFNSCAHVNLVRAWADPLPEEEATDEDGEPYDSEDWMKIHLGVVSPHYYVYLGGDDSWYAYYRAPPDGLCIP
ncbi:unnamed protein product [Clonostachys byssicola]|uniref:Uncharacterized protein n=1 Tax=Clonostachys byssicola TaxID=160290 RepID=A0A9N9XZI1_9HYPO|nr:unnamed protein product [Clonostachys byssicola]